MDDLPAAEPDRADTRGPPDLSDWSDILADTDACTDLVRVVRRGENADSEAVPIANGLDAGADRHWRYEAEAALCYLVGTLGSEAPAELKAACALLNALPRTWPPTDAELAAARDSVQLANSRGPRIRRGRTHNSQGDT